MFLSLCNEEIFFTLWIYVSQILFCRISLHNKNIYDEYKIRSATEVYIEALTQLCGYTLFYGTREPLDQPTSSDF